MISVATGDDDGRKARRARSRLKIVHAFKDLVREGAAAPSATDVADKAGVGLRTVYRCFRGLPLANCYLILPWRVACFETRLD